MKINLDGMHSPCQQCYIHGHLYSPEDNVCQRCEYAIAMNILHSACKTLSGSCCGYCRHYTEGCTATTDCEWHIDWNRAVKDFNIKEW